ncbi:hypothetical protein NM688_g6729 [Phlebia brevispora]|uniref:Uncharacterized protein n=1 Tax=Phlebia brevispora TaxID=194682 RepID=A0ACC1SD18_9APHY|nr:hypothetical protein NM688_g6729 [Phlebia brevispora]
MAATFTGLRRVVDSLKLNPKRTEITASASKVKLQDMANAGVTQVSDLFGTMPQARYFQEGDSLTANIVRYLEVVADKCFKTFKREENAPNETVPKVRVPMEVKDIIDCEALDNPVDVAHALASIEARWVSRHIPKEENPLLLVSDHQEFQDAKGRMDENYPRPYLEYPVSSPNTTSEERMDVIRYIMSWFYALILTAEPNGEGKDSEMTVQFIIGSIIRYITQLPGCEIWSDRRIQFPSFMKMNGKESTGHAHPDIAARPIPTFNAELNAALRDKSENIKIIVQQLLQPVIILGEAKRSAAGSEKPGKPNDSHYTAQMAMAAYPSLVALILLYLDGKEFDPAEDNEELPEEFFIYGIYYDEEKVELWAHIPYYQSESTSDGPGWRFVQTKLATIELATHDETVEMSKANAQKRIQFAIAMQAVRDQGLRLYNRFTSPEYKHILAQLLRESKAH